MGGASGKVAYIGMVYIPTTAPDDTQLTFALEPDTEGTFRPERYLSPLHESQSRVLLIHHHRIAQIAERFGSTHSPPPLSPQGPY